MNKTTHQVFVDDVALELIVPTIVQVLLFDEITDADMPEVRGLRQSRSRRRFTGTRSPRDQ